MNESRNWLLIPFFLSVLCGYSQTVTINDGSWTNATNWSSGIPTTASTALVLNNMIVNTDITINNGTYTINGGSMLDDGGGRSLTLKSNGSFDVNGNATFSGPLSSEGFSLVTIQSGDTVRIGGNAAFSNNSSLVMLAGSVLIISGNLEIKNSFIGLIDGQIYVNGNLTGSNSASLSGLGNLEVSGSTQFNQTSSAFGITADCNPGPCELGSGIGLPIVLLSFSAYFDVNETLVIEWSTASEINNDYFTISYSTDGIGFSELNTTKGAGTSYDKIDYELKLSDIKNEVVYLRLKQTDYDGRFDEFEPILVRKSQNNFNTEVYPNPFNDFFMIKTSTSPHDFVLYDTFLKDHTDKLIVEKISPTLIRVKTNGLIPACYILKSSFFSKQLIKL